MCVHTCTCTYNVLASFLGLPHSVYFACAQGLEVFVKERSRRVVNTFFMHQQSDVFVSHGFLLHQVFRMLCLDLQTDQLSPSWYMNMCVCVCVCV